MGAVRYLDFIIRGRDEYSSALNQLNGSLTNVARQGNQNFNSLNRSSGLLSEQLRILRRSFEYSISGMGLYKIYQAIGAYKAFRSELGQLNTTLELSGKRLNDLGTQAIDVSNKTGQSLQNVLESFRNIAQTYPTLKPQSIAAFASVEAMGANVIGAQPQHVGSTVGAIASAFVGRNKILDPKQGPRIIAGITDMLVRAQKSGLPNVTGEELLGAAQNLIGGAKVGRFTFPQAMAYWTVLQRQFPDPSRSSLYLRQLMSRIITPTKSEAAYYARAGMPAGAALAGLTGNQIIQQLVKAVIEQPGANMTYEQAVKSGYKNLKIGPEGILLLEKAIGGRLQSGIAANLLVSGFGQISPQEKIFNQAYQNRNGTADTDLAKRNTIFLAQNQLSLAATRIANTSTTLLNDLNPLISKTAEYTGDVALFLTHSNKFLQEGAGNIDRLLRHFGPPGQFLSDKHGGGIAEILLGALGIKAGSRSLKSLGERLTGTNVGRILSRLPGLGKLAGEDLAGPGAADAALKLIRGPLDLQALQNAFVGKANGTASAPFWVVIHPLSRQTMGWGGKGPAGNDIEKMLAKFGIKAAEDTAAVAAAATARAAAKSGTVADAIRTAARAGARGAASAAGRGSGLIASSEAVGGGLGLRVASRFLGPGALLASFLMSNGTRTTFAPHGKNQVPVTYGDYANFVQKGSLADLVFNFKPKFSTNAKQVAQQIQLQNLIQRLRNLPVVAEAERRFAMGELSSKQLEQILNSEVLSVKNKKSRSLTAVTDASKQHTRQELLIRRLYSLPSVAKAEERYAHGQISHAQLDKILRTAEHSLQRKMYVSRDEGKTIVPGDIDATFRLVPTDELKNLIKPQKVRAKVPMKYVPSTTAPTSKTKTTTRNNLSQARTNQLRENT